ncbi:MAG: hypothetical protein J0H74_18610 [Chitinophagaceae bacterium]|nr:hypothetical protein [Chitinophagaceae bacterium]
MVELSNEISTIVFNVLTKEATEEDLQQLKDWCHQRDKSGVLFSQLSDAVWIARNLELFNKIRVKEARMSVWQRILDSFPSEGSPDEK